MASALPSLDYIAGFFDGEGWLTIYRNKHGSYTNRIGMANSDAEIIWLINTVLSQNGIDTRVEKRSLTSPKHKASYGLYITKKLSILNFCHLIVSAVFIKRVRIEVMTEFCSTSDKDKRDFLCDYMGILNRKGVCSGTD